ncbi:MAG: type I restriction endonuclease [Chloroflexota bacterium]|nr:type I restriction endonuclease [Chloroflexota bacterium]
MLNFLSFNDKLFGHVIMNVIETLRVLSCQVEQRLPAAKRSEANTSQFLVMPFFEALGYSVHNPNDVEPEFTADLFASGTRVDYALKKAGKPIVLIEVKRASVKLERHHTRQLHYYFSSKLDVRFGIVTNGLEYRFYSDLDLPNVMDDEPFLTLNMLNLDDSLMADLELFTKSSFDKDRVVDAARIAKNRAMIRRVLNTEFDPLSPKAIEFILNIALADSTVETRRTELTQLVKEEWQLMLELSAPPPDLPPVDKIEIKDPSPGPDPSAGERKTSQSGTIPIHAEFEGRRLKAELYVKGGLGPGGANVFYRGKWLTAKEAGRQARKSVNADRDEDWSGWWWWRFEDPVSGESRLIRDLHSDDDILQRLRISI